MQTGLDIIPRETRRVLVAYSGGLDSSVLLHLLMQQHRDYQIIPWHINHGLLEVAAQMEQFCIEQAQDYGLKIRIDRLELVNVESNIEAEARRQRYQLFEQFSETGDCILTAHHADDQAETFLLNALRGSGSAGLRGIARVRQLGEATLARPLLDCSRAELEAYAGEWEISWFNDPSNRQNRFDRNYLRNEIVPLLRNRWPHFRDALTTASDLQAETQAVLDEIAADDLTSLSRAESDGIATLDLPGLLELTPGRRHNLIRYWISQSGLSALPQARLRELDKQLLARPDATPEISMTDYSIRIYDRRLFLVQEHSKFQGSGEYEFGLRNNIDIDSIHLHLKRSTIFERLEIVDQDQPLTLKFRQRGQENQDRHRLKRLFQKHRVPPWRRSSVAQVYLDGKLEGILP